MPISVFTNSTMTLKTVLSELGIIGSNNSISKSVKIAPNRLGIKFIPFRGFKVF
jgi:hypothetical protein